MHTYLIVFKDKSVRTNGAQSKICPINGPTTRRPSPENTLLGNFDTARVFGQFSLYLLKDH